MQRCISNVLVSLLAVVPALAQPTGRQPDLRNSDVEREDARYAISLPNHRAVDKRECLPEEEFHWQNRRTLLERLAAFAEETSAFRLRRLTIVPCDPVYHKDLWNGAVVQAFGVGGSTVAHLVLDRRNETIQLSGTSQPHSFHVGERLYDVFSFTILEVTVPPKIDLHVRTRQMPSLHDAIQLEQYLEKHLGIPGLFTEIYVTSRAGELGPDHGRPTLGDEGPGIICERGDCSLINVDKRRPLPGLH